MWWAAAFLVGFVPALLGGLAGLVLGNLRWPFVLALVNGPASLAAGTNIAVSTLSAVGGTYQHVREGRFDASLFALLGAAAMVGGLVGSFFTRLLPTPGLLWLLTGLVFYEAVQMLLRAEADSTAPASGSRPRHYGAEVAIGFGIGMLSGTVGLLLGSLRLPAMIRWLGVDARRAVGTNMAIGLAQGLTATAGHLWQGQVALVPLVVVGVAAFVGSSVGACFTGRLPVPMLKRAIGWTLLVVAAAMAWTAARQL